MAEFIYNNVKNVSFSYTLFEFNCDYYSLILYKNNINPYFKSKSADKQSAKLREMMIVCIENFYHTQKLQKQAYNKSVRSKNYTPSYKNWLNNKYIRPNKIKC